MCESRGVNEAIADCQFVWPWIHRRGRGGRGAHPALRYNTEDGPQQLYLDQLPLGAVHLPEVIEGALQVDYGFFDCPGSDFVVECYLLNVSGDARFARDQFRYSGPQFRCATQCRLYRFVQRDGRSVSRWHTNIGVQMLAFEQQARVSAISGRTRDDRARRLHVLAEQTRPAA